MYMYMYLYIYTYTHVITYMYIYIYIYMHTYIHTCVHVYVYCIHIDIHTSHVRDIWPVKPRRDRRQGWLLLDPKTLLALETSGGARGRRRPFGLPPIQGVFARVCQGLFWLSWRPEEYSCGPRWPLTRPQLGGRYWKPLEYTVAPQVPKQQALRALEGSSILCNYQVLGGYLGAQVTYYLLCNCTYQPPIGSLGRGCPNCIWLVSGW